MKLQLVNDLHTECGVGLLTHLGHEPKADVLVIAGDFCSWRTHKQGVDMLRKAADVYEQIIYVLGNHEFYHGEYHEVCDYWGAIDIAPNVHVLQGGQACTIKDVVFVGATLWTNGGDRFDMDYMQQCMNDFRIIKYTTEPAGGYKAKGKYARKFTPMHMRNVHLDEGCQIYNMLDQIGTEEKIVMVTHHLPHLDLITPRWRGNPLNPAFATDYAAGVLELYKNIKLWHFGHTHDSIDMEIEGTRFVCNPYGYHGHAINHGFNKEKIIEV